MKPTTAPTAAQASGFATDAQVRVLLSTLVLAAFSSALMLTPVNIAVPNIMRTFGIDAATSSWLPLSYLIAVGATVVPAGKIAERMGRPRMFVLALCLASVGSLLAAATVSFAGLLGARVVQGVGAGMMFSVSSAMVAQSVPPKQRGEKLGLVLTATYLGLTVGPLVGGLLTQFLHWRFVLAVPVPLLLASLTIALGRGLIVPKTDAPTGKFDLRGAVLYASGMVSLIIGVSALPDPRATALAIVGLVLLVSFVRHGLRATTPVFDVRLFFKNPLFARSCFASVLMYSAIFSTTFVMSILLQEGHRLSAVSSGALLTIQPLLMAGLSKRTGRLSDIVEPRWLATGGLVLCSGGLLLMSASMRDGGLWFAAIGLTFSGLGVATFSAPNHNAIMGSVQRHELGAASSALAVVRILGQMLSMVTVACVFSWLARDLTLTAPLLSQTACLWSLRIAAALCVIGAVVSYLRGNLHAAPQP